jgi:threonyl-tRNA synthetase
VGVIPITDDQVPYARNVERRLHDAGLRAEVDDRGDRMQAKIRSAQIQKIPYMLVIGKRELEQEAVSVRLRSGQDLGSMPIERFVELANGVVASRSLELTA